MKKIVLAMLLVAAVTAVAQTTPAPAAAAPAQKKEIKDPAEYNAYVGAAGQSDPAAQVSGFEAFLTQYPNSNFKEEALELLMVAYQKTGNQAKMVETAQKTLQVNPCNIRALALVTYAKQAGATGPTAQQSLAEAGQSAEKGLQCWTTATKPVGTPDADWDKLRTQTTGIFNNAAGMAAYAAKDYAKAEKYLKAGVDADPANLTEVYYLALADLTPGATEIDLEGLFYIARAANLATADGKAKIAQFGKSKYVKYHGSEEGWDKVMALAATATKPPDSFTITKYVPPTPAEQAATWSRARKWRR